MRRALVAVTAFLLLAACTTDEGDPLASAGRGGAGTPETGETLSVLEQELEFVECMRGEGVEIVDPIPGDTSGRSAVRYEIDVNGKGSDPAFQAALEVCQHLLPEVEFVSDVSPEDQERLLEFANCVRDNGLPHVEDPDPEGLVVITSEEFGSVTREEAEAQGVEIVEIRQIGGGYVIIPQDTAAVEVVEQCRQFLPDPEVDLAPSDMG